LDETDDEEEGGVGRSRDEPDVRREEEIVRETGGAATAGRGGLLGPRTDAFVWTSAKELVTADGVSWREMGRAALVEEELGGEEGERGEDCATVCSMPSWDEDDGFLARPRLEDRLLMGRREWPLVERGEREGRGGASGEMSKETGFGSSDSGERLIESRRFPTSAIRSNVRTRIG
jgi:hypothetical protein